jgi:hypothetical protein
LLSVPERIQRLAGCLSGLPDRLRLLLEMRGGIGMSRPLSLADTSRQLHVSLRQARRMQKRALRLLMRTARSRGCGAPAGIAAIGIANLGDAALAAAAQPFGALGGVLAAHYSQQPSGIAPTPGATQRGIGAPNALGVSPTSGSGGGPLLVVGIVLAGMVLIAILFAEELGLGPHFRRARVRWLRRLRR